MKKLILFIFVLFVSFSYGQYRFGTTAAHFLEIGTSSRAVSMGEAFVALADMRKTTGALLTVDGGNVAAMVR